MINTHSNDIHEALTPPPQNAESAQRASNNTAYILEHFGTADDLRDNFRIMPAGKTGSLTGTTREHFLHASDHILEALCPLANGYLDGYFPTVLRDGAMSGILKESWRIRPVTLLEAMARAIDTRVTKRWNECIDRDGTMTKDQFGFRIDGNPTDPSDIVTAAMEDARTYNDDLTVLFEDCSEAFDSMGDPGLDVALQMNGIDDRFIEWIM
jgi:hypothetical protein